MWERYNDHTVQAPRPAMTEEAVKTVPEDYSANREKLRIVRDGTPEEADRALTELLELTRGLLRKVVARFRDRGADPEDLMQIGTVGMIKAVRSFDLERGTSFSTYAVPLIFGEIRRYLRDEGPIKISRNYKKLGAMLMREKNRIAAEEGREPRISELAAACGVTPEEASIALDAMTPMLSLSDSAFHDDSGAELGDVVADTESSGEIERLCDRIALGQAISHLPPDWQKIITLRYYRNMTQQQVADFLGITQVKVSREEKKIIESLRAEMIR